jgi:bifunctional DNase/RNase
MSDMVEVVIDSIRVSLMSQNRMVILRETGQERYLPIWIGVYEAEAITLALQEVEVSRPLTWDLLKNVLHTLGARVVRVEVVALREDTFYGNIVIEYNDRLINIDSRPSDAIALAVRTHVPILVSRQILNSAGIEPEEDLQEATEEPENAVESAADAEPGDAGASRLSIFEDFLDQLDLGKIDPPDESDDQPDQDK